MDNGIKDGMDIFSIRSETAVITGAASGIGAKIAEFFYSLGANVILVDIDESNLRAQQDRIKSIAKGEQACEMFVCDVTDEPKVKDLLAFALERFGMVDILVNSHGIARRASADEITAEQFDSVIGINLRGVFLTTATIGRHMVQKKKGSIINISSIAAHVCMPNNVNYSAAKGGLEAMTRSFAGEWAKHGIRVNAIAPGPCKTNFTESLYADPVYVKNLTQKIPRGEIATAEDIMGPALLLASRAGANIIGQILVVDGGFIII